MACVAHSLPTTTAVCCNPNLFLYFCATNFVVQLRTGPVHTFPELESRCVRVRVYARVCAPARERARIEMYLPAMCQILYCIVLYYYYY